MTPREAFAFYKTLGDKEQDKILDLISQLSFESNKWRLVEAVQQYKQQEGKQ